MFNFFKKPKPPRRALVIIAQHGYQDVELDGTRKGLIDENFTVDLCSKKVGECTGKLGGTEKAMYAMHSVDLSPYDRFAFIGGPGARELREDKDALELARKIAATGKVYGAICIAPTILAAAGVLKGKEATTWNEDGDQGIYLEDHGVFYTGDNVTVFENIVTANGPEYAERFGEKLAAL